MTYYRRSKPEGWEGLRARLVSFGAAAGVGAVVYYVTRVFLSREPLEPLEPLEPFQRAGSDEDQVAPADPVPTIPSRSHPGS